MTEHIEVRVTCAKGHPLATFAPTLIPEDGAWVGDGHELATAPWGKWGMVTETALPAAKAERINIHIRHDTSRAGRDGEDWRFYCRRCRRAVRVSDRMLGASVTKHAADGKTLLNIEDAC